MKKHLSTILLVIVLLAGLSLLLYPTVANFVNSRTQSYAIATYREKLETEVVSYEADWAAARDYNRRLMEGGSMRCSLMSRGQSMNPCSTSAVTASWAISIFPRSM